MKGENLISRKFGRLTVKSLAGKTKNRCLIWLCECDCGNMKKIESRNLLSQNTRSCGCLQKDVVSKCTRYSGVEIRRNNIPRLYRIWKNIKSRCFNKNTIKYFNYGGRGIAMCEEWKMNFETFHDWALKNGYSDTLTIDRIDVNGDYEPANCRWATYKEQNTNKRNSKITI